MTRVRRQALVRCTALGALLALALVTVPASARPTAAKVEILFVTPDALTDFAMDGDQVAWIGERRIRVNEDVVPCGLVAARSLRGGPTRTTAPRDDGTYGDVCAGDRLALVGRRLFWVSTFGAHERHERVDTALIGAATSRTLADHTEDSVSGGSFVDETAGGAGTFAYTSGITQCDIDEYGSERCEVGKTAHVSVFRDGRETGFRVGVRPTLLAAAAGRVTTLEGREAFSRVGEIVVYTPAGRVVRRLKESGFVGGLGLSARWVAAVIGSGPSRQLRVFDVRSGATAVSVELPTRTRVFQVAVSGTHAVVATGRTVWALNIAAKSLARLAERPYVVRGLSIEGRRVAWGERVGSRGRVMSAMLE